MKQKYVFPAVFLPLDDGKYGVRFPDIPNCFTQGDTFEDAVYMAKDVLAAMLVAMEDDKDEIPEATIPYHEEGLLVSYFDADTVAYRRKVNSKAVKRMVSLPGWLNERAEQEGVNFSQTLQDALKERLGIAQ